jgi:chemotaxis protein CheX
MSLFNIKEESCFVVVEIIKDIIPADIESLKLELKKLLLYASDNFILDFRNVTNLQQSIFAPFILFSKELKTNKKQIYSLNINSELIKIIRESGLDSVFNYVENLDIANALIQKSKESKASVDVDFINPFLKATVQTLSVQANTKVEIEKPFIKTKEHVVSIDIAGVINIISSKFKGSITLCFPKNVFLQIYENMLGEKHTEISNEIQDGCGELLNIIFGNAKAELNAQKGYVIEKAIPTILTGEKLKVNQTTAHSVFILPFRTAAGTFYIEVVIDNS